MIERASQLPEPEFRLSAAELFGYSEAEPTSVARRLRDGKSFVAWAGAALRSSSVRRSLRLHHPMGHDDAKAAPNMLDPACEKMNRRLGR